RGPARAETAPQARVDAGQGVSQSDLQGLQQLLERLWNPNCGVEGGSGVVVPVKFAVGEDGQVVGRVTDRGASSDPVVFAAARRAIDAVHQAEPYAAPYRGKSFTVNFDAKKACEGR
ncbi:MAG: energy transducer TonB, partial [Pseudomonadota bacterium]|nr:energy transducer TonB [Pseudomonadota bacterium]